jgi:TolB protein
VRNKLKRLFNLNSNSKTVSSVFTNISEYIDDESPAFSPDGKQIVWVRTDKSKLGQSEVWISDNNLKNPHVLVSSPSKIYANPSWHPNKNDILFAADAASESPDEPTATEKPQNIEIYAIRKDGSCLRRITFNTADDRMPRVSPEGSQLLFTSNRSGVLQLYLMNYQPPPCPQN